MRFSRDPHFVQRVLQQFNPLYTTFVISLMLSLIAVYITERTDIAEKRHAIQHISSGYINLIENNIAQAVSATYPLAAFVRTQDGDMTGFEELATAMLPFYPGLSSMQLQPHGTTMKVIPLQGNERTLGQNVFSDVNRHLEARLARDSGELTLAGPFSLKQGGFGAVARLPIYLEDDNGQYFWGFANSILRFPDVLTPANLDSLTQAGYAYQLSRTHPKTGEIQTFVSSQQKVLADSEIFAIHVPNAQWSFHISPIQGWQSNSMIMLKAMLAFIVSSFMTFIAFLIMKVKRDHIELEQLVEKRTEELSILAHYDVLTKLPNRSLFASQFEEAVVRCHQTGLMLAVCFLDLDDFKLINDRFGHEEGDNVLVKVAERIQATIKPNDTASRQGGDEFILLLNDIASEQELEQFLHHITTKMSDPYQINDRHHQVQISYGVTLYPKDNADLDRLLRHADRAMYQAKLMGKNRYQLYDRFNDNLITQKHSLINEIQTALDDNQLTLYYQPKVMMSTGNVFGAEALIRWIHPQKGMIPPLDFLPSIESTPLEIAVGGWVIKQALKQLADWQQQGIDLVLSINISSHHLLASEFFDQLERALSDHPTVPAHHLQLEILESSTLGDINAINRIIKHCQQQLGVDIALDDFGTGYSSLTHLRSLSASTIKIDQTFVRDLLDDPNDYTIIDGVISLADAFHCDIIAEGVETTEHGLMLLMMGCDQAQGYGISRPLPNDAFIDWLSQYKPNQTWLDFSRSDSAVHENKLMMIKLTLSAWYQVLLEQFAQTAPDPYPRLKPTHLSVWLERLEQDAEFDTRWFNQLLQAHDDLTRQAQHLIKQHKQSGSALTAQQVTAFEQYYQAIMSLMKTYQTTSLLSLFQSNA